MKILIISGFLGAGKTTFIKSLAKNTGREIAIFENEYGEVGIDGDRLRKSFSEGEAEDAAEKKVNIWEMTEGCICCSAKGDFASSVLTIANTVDPEYLVIEPTGVALLRNLIDNLKKIEYERIKLASPITVVDGKNHHAHRTGYRELFEEQIKNAKTLIVSKTEEMSGDEIEAIRQELHSINPAAAIEMEHYSKKDKKWWTELIKSSEAEFFAHEGEAVKPGEQGAFESKAESFSMSEVCLESPEQLIILLEDMLRGKYGDIVRAKGSLKAGEQDMQFDLAGAYYSIRTAEDGATGSAVFIGKGIKRQKLRKIFFEKSKYVKIKYRK